MEFELPKSFTAGDIDGDGDLDVWIGQYKFPYVEGSMPTPFYDSNDGHPAVLLENDGQGNFRDVTESAGLAAKTTAADLQQFTRRLGSPITTLT